MNTTHAAQVLRHAAPMFGTFAPRSGVTPRVQAMDFADEDPSWVDRMVRKGVRSDSAGLPMLGWMSQVGIKILVDLR